MVQEFAPNSGWDHKLWAVGDQALRGPAPFRTRRPRGGAPPCRSPPTDLPPGWAALVRRVGEVFALDVYGVDIIDTGDGAPLIVDINAFPGVRGQSGAPEALAALALHRARRQRRILQPVVDFSVPAISGSRTEGVRSSRR